MVIMRIIIRVLLLPVRMCLTIIQLVVMFITWLSDTIFHVLSGIICITSILGYGFGQETGTETIRMLAVGFILYILPTFGEWIVIKIAVWKLMLKRMVIMNENDGRN